MHKLQLNKSYNFDLKIKIYFMIHLICIYTITFFVSNKKIAIDFFLKNNNIYFEILNFDFFYYYLLN